MGPEQRVSLGASEFLARHLQVNGLVPFDPATQKSAQPGLADLGFTVPNLKMLSVGPADKHDMYMV